MALNPSFGGRESYTRTAIAFHWLIALLIVCGFALGWVMTDIPGFTPTKLRYFSWHKWIGVTVFALAVVRILWRATPPPPADAAPHADVAARCRASRASAAVRADDRDSRDRLPI